GAAAILNYNVILSPLAQPRNAIVGNTLSAIVGVSITKLFTLSPSSFDDHRWLAGPLCCGAASWAMTMTNTVFPPGGATAVLAATDPTVGAMGWVFVPVVLLGSVLMLAVALLTNNVQRQYPAFWWTPRDVGRRRRGADIESASRRGEDDEKRSGRTRSSTAEADRDRGNDDLSADDEASRDRKIVITERRVLIPDSFSLGPVESQWVEMLRDRLRSEVRCYNPSEASLDQDSTGTLHSSRDMLPSLKSQKSQGDA
ncbi:HPP domain-containing protein, partial [Macrophomina phaseolina MS6]